MKNSKAAETLRTLQQSLASPDFPVREIKELVRAVNTANRAMRKYNRAKSIGIFPRNYFILLEAKPDQFLCKKFLGSVLAEVR